MNDLILRARLFAIGAHSAAGQLRKYTGEPYWHHCQRVAGTIEQYPSSTPEMVAAAWLHDTVEDTAVTREVIEELFGPTVALYVHELTDVPKEFGNRSKRFEANTAKLKSASSQAQTIKLADIIDNTSNILAYDRSFASLYLNEKAEVLKALTRGNLLLWWEAKDQLDRGLVDLAREAA